MNKKLNEITNNNQGCLMKIVEYENSDNVVVEFQDKYRGIVHTSYRAFCKGSVKNPYYPTAYGVGIIGNKYPRSKNRKNIKEYITWRDMLRRCFDVEYKEKHPTYKDVTCCKEWLNYENFYEWLHSQENFDKWLNGDKWSIDKDILVKGNKIYSPEMCVLSPHNVNSLFVKCDSTRGSLPIGVVKDKYGFIASYHNPYISNKSNYIGHYSTFEKAFYEYKVYKENIIKQIAQIEYESGNITEQCYRAMMEYEVEITD